MTTTIDDLKEAIEETEADRNEVFLQSQTLREETFQAWLDNQELEISDEELDKIAEQLGGKIEDVEIMRESLTQLQNDFADHLENHPSGSGGSGGGGGTCNLSSTFSGGSFSDSTVIEIPYNFYSSNLGTSMLYVEIKASNGELDTMTLPILENGEGVCRLGVLAKNTYTVRLYALDSRGVESNPLTFKIDVGSLEVTSTFNDNINYQISDAINIPLVVSSARNAEITAYIVIDGKEYTQTVIKGYNMFQLTTAMKTVGVHKVVIYLSNGVETSNTLTYNIVIINPYTLLISTKQEEITIDYGYVINLEYKISATTNMDVFVTYYIDNNVVGSYTVSTGDNIWRITDRLDSGQHTLKVVASSGVGQAELVVPLTVKESTFEPIEHVEAGLVAYFNANDKSNVDEDKQVWVSRVPNDNGDYINATLYNYNYSSNGWEDGWLHSTVGSYVEIDFQPLLNNVLSGFTFDILFRSRHMGQDDNIVASCRDLVGTQKGFIITSDEARIKGDTNNIYNKYMDNEETRVTFVIDRTSTYIDADGKTQENPMVQIYLNGVLSSASLLTDSGSGSNRVYESFATNSKIYLNGLSGGDSAGESFIKTVRVYNRPLGHEEVLQNVLADIEDISVQREQYELNYELLEQLIPTMYFYDSEIGTHANMTKDNKQYIRIRYDSPDENKFGKSFDYPVCQTAWQGTSSLQYPIKNYKFKLYDYAYDETTGEPISTTDSETFVKKKINPYTDGTGYEESTFCLKADYMESSHGRNTGTAKFVNNVLFAGANNPAKQQDSKVRETINGFPIVLYINGQRMGIYNFNHDKSCSKSLGFETIPNMFRFEISANSETTTGAFNKTWSSSATKENIYEELLSDYEIAYDEDRFKANDGEFDVTSYYDALGLAHDGTVMGGYKDRALLALAEFIQFVSESSDEEYKENLHKYCDIKHAIRYWINVQMLGMIDNYAKNTMINCYDGHIFYFAFYDMDSSIGLDNTGYQINPSDIEMMDKDSTNTYYFNCATSKMWSKLFRCFYDEICEEYINLRNGAFTQETIKKYIVEEQIDQIPIILYNQDQFSKYISQGRQYLHMLHGRNKEHIIRWIDERIKFLDSLFMGIQSIYTSKSITIRSNNPSSNTTYTATLNITPYYSQYITVKWRNGEFETHKVKKGQTQKYSFNMVNATDNEVLIYSADNLKTIGTLQNMNPSSLDIGNATELIELSCKSSPALLKVDVSKNVKLQKINLNGCSMLGDETGGSGANILDVRNCVNLTYVDVRGTKTSNVLNNPNGCAIETLYLGDNVNIVRLVGYSRLKNFTCGSGVTSFIAKDASLNTYNYLNTSTIEEFEIDNCGFDTSLNITAAAKPNLKRLVLKNINNLTSITMESNVQCTVAKPTKDDVTFNLNYVEFGNLPNLTTLNFGRRSTSTTNSQCMFGFDDNDATIYLHDLPKLTTITTGGISGLNKMIIPDTLTNLILTTASTTSTNSIYTMGDLYLYINYSYQYDKDQAFFTWDTILSETAYKENPTRSNVICLKNSNCVIKQSNKYAASKFVNYDYCTVDFVTDGTNHYEIKDDTKITNSIVNISNKNSSYPSSGYPLKIYGVDFETCEVNYNVVLHEYPNHIYVKNCIFTSYNQFSNMANKLYTIIESYYSQLSPNTFNCNIELESGSRKYALRNQTVNGNVSIKEDVSTSYYALSYATVNGNVIINSPISEYFGYHSNISGVVTVGNKVTNAKSGLSYATCGEVNIDENMCGNLTDFMKNTNCEEAPLLPIGTTNIDNCFANSTITKTPNNWDREYTSLVNDSTVTFNAYTGCNITQIAPVVDGVVGEYVGGSLDEVYIHWGGNKRYDMPRSRFKIVLSESDIPFTMTLNTSDSLLVAYGDTTNWGDGTEDTENKHIYNAAGEYIIETSKWFAYDGKGSGMQSKITEILYLQNNFKTYQLFLEMNNLTYINFGKPRKLPSNWQGCNFLVGNTQLTIEMDCSNLTTLEYFIGDSSTYFHGYERFVNVILKLKNTSNIKSTRYMFRNCHKLTSLDLSNFDASNVTDMSYMFNNCGSLASLDVSNFNTSSAITMGYMFQYCSSLTSLDLSNWNTSNVAYMNYMFNNCGSLTSLDISNWNNSKVTSMDSMFAGCTSLTSLDLSNFNTSNVTNMNYMFYSCSKLTSLDLSNFNTSNVTNMYAMFRACSSLTSLDLSNFDTSSVTSMEQMFYSCSKLTSLDLSNFNTSKVTDMQHMFYGCSSLTSLDVSNFNTGEVTSMYYMFAYCSSLTSLDVSNFNNNKVTDMGQMFQDCSSLTSLDLSHFNTSNVINMYCMFQGCYSLTSLDLSNFNTSKVINTAYMFYSCSKLTSLDLSNFNTSNVTNMDYMFYKCGALTSLDVSNFNTGSVTNMGYMFAYCSSLTSLDVSNFNTSKVTNMGYMFRDCTSLTSLDISNWDTSEVKTYSNFLNNTSTTLTIYYNSSLTSNALTAWKENMYSSKTWIDVSTQNLAQQVSTLQEESDIMMLALTELYETNATNGATTNTSTATTFGLRARATVSYIDVLMPTIYAKLIRRGYKTIDDVPATLQTSVQEILNQTE